MNIFVVKRNFAPASAGNMALLVELRWIAIAGQALAVAMTSLFWHVALPLETLIAVIALLAGVNIATLLISRRRSGYSYLELLFALMIDVEALYVQLFATGGTGNPFTFLFLLQIVIGAILLPPRWSWMVALTTCVNVELLTLFFHPLILPLPWSAHPLRTYLLGSMVCFVLIAALLVFFIVKLDHNRRDSDKALALMRQQADEEQHIIRMGLLASGAAHALGTPLASMSVILGDWAHHRAISGHRDLAGEVGEMQIELKRCKEILSSILMAAGEARGENPQVTSLRQCMDEIVAKWRQRCGDALVFHDDIDHDITIVADPALREVIGNVIDNAREVSPDYIAVSAKITDAMLVLEVSDHGPGFDPAILAHFGRPYISSKAREGGGIGLFLFANVVRKLGGHAEAKNLASGGALVRMTVPLSAISFSGPLPKSISNDDQEHRGQESA